MGACYSQPENKYVEVMHDKTRLCGPGSTQHVEYQIEPAVAPNAGYQANSSRSLGNEMVVGGSSNNLNHAYPTQFAATNVVKRANDYGQGGSMVSLGGSMVRSDYGQGSVVVGSGDSLLQNPIIPGSSMTSLGRAMPYNDHGLQGGSMASLGGTIVGHQQGNSMGSLGGSTRFNDYRQGNSAVSLGGSILKRPLNQQGNNMVNSSGSTLETPINQQGNSMANLSGSILQNPINPQGNSMASLGGSILKKPVNPQGNSMASLGGAILEEPINPHVNSMASLGVYNPYNDYGPGNSMASLGGSIIENRIPGPGATLIGNSAGRRESEPVEVGYPSNDVQINNDHQRGGATVNTSSTNLQNTGPQQVGSGVLMEMAVNEAQLKKEYDATIGGMVYVLDKNQTIDGLEPFTPYNTSRSQLSRGHDEMELGNQSMSRISQTEMASGAGYGNQQGAGIAYETQVGANNISNPKIQSEVNIPTDQSGAYPNVAGNPMQVQHMSHQNIGNQFVESNPMTSVVDQSANINKVNIATDQRGAYPNVADNPMEVQHMSHQNIGNQFVGSRSMTNVVDQSANMKPAGKNVYDPSIGEMVYVPNDKVQVTGQETSEVNTRKPTTESMQAVDKKEGS